MSVNVAATPVPFWGFAGARARIENTLDQPIAVLSVELRAADGSVLGRGGSEFVPAEVTENEAVVEGTLLVDDPGPQARAPFPDRWDWRGAARLVHFPVLRPGQSFETAGSVRVTHRTGNRVVALLRYAVLADDAALLKVTQRSLKSLPPPAGGTFGKGWVPTRRMAVTFERATEIAKFPHRKDPWAEGPAAAALPNFYPQALSEADYKALEATQAKTTEAEATFQVEGPPLSLVKARERAGVADGLCTYFPARSAWVLEAEGTTHIVGSAAAEKHVGRLVALIDALTAREPVEVTLFAAASVEDPGGHVAFLAEKGFKAQSTKQKGGTYRGTVEVRSADVATLLPALAERGLKIDGLQALPTSP